MKDTKFKVMCGLLGAWAILLILTLSGVRAINPRFWQLLALICVGWFIYWTISYVREWLSSDSGKSDETPTSEQQTKTTQQSTAESHQTSNPDKH